MKDKIEEIENLMVDIAHVIPDAIGGVECVIDELKELSDEDTKGMIERLNKISNNLDSLDGCTNEIDLEPLSDIPEDLLQKADTFEEVQRRYQEYKRYNVDSESEPITEMLDKFFDV